MERISSISHQVLATKPPKFDYKDALNYQSLLTQEEKDLQLKTRKFAQTY